ncbi:HET-domain-containing protein [Leucogyrophana mollusca]|uniref:HET-domain-containing protein n=1 Tax=Leucogyrophana mollusca TaxID=85980 RepID=A0ACB8BMT9_9AGAM|nr:HET-domain-containing protein [Leucogyrophana mollusca]
MYLLNTETLKLEEPQRTPTYAILSHVWGEEEVTFRDINKPSPEQFKGYTKIEHCCAQALADGYKYLWIDTCCIDKRSSAELSEAINSMYRWYAEAQICYAYLEDVPSDEDPADENSRFRNSKWFSRGWTLQEGIAPRRIVFLAGDWVKIGSKAGLISVIASITGVDEGVLSGELPLAEVSIARKMSWASRRQTTRVEDRAYSLMGIFGVHMPLLYGEGENAFIRLQHEIMRASNDQSIFAWTSTGAKIQWSLASALFAPSPDNFQHSTTIDRIPSTAFTRLFASTYKNARHKSDFSLTNSGVQISMPIRANPWSVGYTAALACSDEGRLVGIHLSCKDGLFRRVFLQHVLKISGPYDDFVATDMTISATADNGSNPPPRPFPRVSQYESEYLFDDVKEAFVRVLRVEDTQAAQEGFVLSQCSLGDGISDATPDREYKWTPGCPYVFFYQNRASREEFCVTIGWRSNRSCVHIDLSRLGLYELHGNESRCNNSDIHPGEWAFKPLRGEMRVTVTTTLGLGALQWDRTWQLIVSISVDRPKCVAVHRPVEQVSELGPVRTQRVRNRAVSHTVSLDTRRSRKRKMKTAGAGALERLETPVA